MLKVEDNERVVIKTESTLFGQPKQYLCIKGSDHPHKWWVEYSIDDYFLKPGRVYKSLCTLSNPLREDDETKKMEPIFKEGISLKEGDIISVDSAEFKLYSNLNKTWPAGFVKYHINKIRGLSIEEGVLSSFAWRCPKGYNGYGWWREYYCSKTGHRRKQPKVHTMFKLIR